METLELTKEQSRSISNYRRMGIDIEILNENTVKIKQARLVNGYILNQKQLVERAKEVFPSFKVIPVPYSLDTGCITTDWIADKMNEFGIKRSDLLKQLAIDESSLSLFLSGERKMNKSQRAAFFFYFLVYELNRDFREQKS